VLETESSKQTPCHDNVSQSDCDKSSSMPEVP
jgi:hypothetical protein